MRVSKRRPPARSAKRKQRDDDAAPRDGARSLLDALAGKRLVVLVGEGGVGKTSMSAAIAWARATAGERVAVLTVDPAPRLGDALGVPAFDAEPSTVALPSAGGSLVAMRLDVKHTFDRMVLRHAPSPAAAQALLDHPIYRAIAGQLGGTDSYMALQRLHEITDEARHDCLVLDTPPAANARELLAAPERLAGLLDTGALSILAEPARIVARAGGTVARATFSLLLAAVERVTGTSLQRDVGDFVRLFEGLVGGLEGRARDIDALLRAPQTAFVLVTRPRIADIETALHLRRDLEDAGIGLAAIVVNRATPARQDASPRPRAGRAKRHSPLPPRLAAAARQMESEVAALRDADAAAIAALRDQCRLPGNPCVFVIPASESDVVSIAGVAMLAARLGAPSAQ
ncbi:MAG TPA: ArsA-related P-loop ATPase [Candidatus Binatia bacterium]